MIGVLVIAALVVGDLRAAFILSGPLDDYGWTYNHNLGRIEAVEAVQQAVGNTTRIQTEVVESVKAGKCKDTIADLVKRGFQLIFATSFTFHDQTFEAASEYPEVDFVHMTGYYSGKPNFATASGKLYQARYLSGVVSAGQSTSGRIGYVASVPIPEVYRNINAYYLGAQKGNASTEVVVLWIGTFMDAVKEGYATEVLAKLGCDVIAYHTDTKASPVTAKAQGKLSTGSNGDQRLSIGESVLTSANFNWGPIYTEYMLRTLSDTFKGHPNRSIWYGYDKGVSRNYPLSFLVSRQDEDVYQAEKTKLEAGTFDPFCSPVVHNGVLQNPSGCLDEFHLQVKMKYIIDGVVDIGFLPSHGGCQAGTSSREVFVHSPPSFDIVCEPCDSGWYAEASESVVEPRICLQCLPGTFSGQKGSANCTPCGEGTYSTGLGSAGCTPCGSGTTNYGEGNTECVSTGQDLTTYYIIAGVLGTVMMTVIVGVVLKLTQSRKTLNLMHTDKMVAIKCAESIANMNLEAVSYIREIENPNEIQLSFIKIIDNLTEFRRYLPQSLVDNKSSQEQSLVSPLLNINPPGKTGTAAILFTDVQHSTMLWELDAEDMCTNLGIHNHVIRGCILRHSGYEVKTIGDSFMVAFEESLAACRCGLDIQEDLYDSDKWTESLGKNSESEYVEGTWKGLRVRIGVNEGEVALDNDTMSGRTDYFGRCVNKAARIEAVCPGGCVAVSAEVFMKVAGSDFELGLPLKHVMGGVVFRGVSGGQVITLLLPKRFPERLEEAKPTNNRRSSLTSTSSASSPLSRSTTGRWQCFNYCRASSIAAIQVDYIDEEDDIRTTLCAAMGSFVTHLERTTGSVVSVFNRLVVVSWNTAIPCPAHLQNAVRWATLCHESMRMTALPVAVHIGIGTGQCSSGFVGTHRQRFASVIGETVDIAFKLSCKAQDLGMGIVFCVLSGDIQHRASLADSYSTRPILHVNLNKTVAEAVVAYQLTDNIVENEKNLNTTWSPEFEDAFHNYEFKRCEKMAELEEDTVIMAAIAEMRKHLEFIRSDASQSGVLC